MAKTIRAKGEGSFYVDERTGKTIFKIMVNGKRKTFSGKNKLECKRRYEEYLQEHSFVTTDDETISLYDAMNQWITIVKSTEVRKSSLDNLYYINNNIIQHTIGKLDYRKVTEENVRIDFIQALMRAKTNRGKQVARSTITKARNQLNEFYNYCLQRHKVQVNPVALVPVPHASNFDEVKKDKRSVFTQDEINKLIKAAEAKYGTGRYISEHAWAIIFIYATGLREQEALALKWDRVFVNEDFTEGYIVINRTLVRNIARDKDLKEIKTDGKSKSEFEIVNATKNSSSERQVVLNNLALRCLKTLQTFDRYRPDGFVITDKDGNFIKPRLLIRLCKQLCGRAGVEYLSPHKLRHTFATTLLMKDVDVKTVADLMGHSTTSTTENIYQHVLKERKQKAVNMIDF